MAEQENKIEIEWSDLSKPISGLKTDCKNVVVIKREAIPIIFVPGIMGSRLEDKQGNKIWDPDALVWMVRNYGMAWQDGAAKKKKVIGDRFDPDYLQVLLDDEEHNDKKFGTVEGADERGWGGVSWSSYGSILTSLQEEPWHRYFKLCFRLPVYAFGYNWTDSNRNTGKKLKEYIDEVIDEQDETCNKVILVTHSMGGLVARSACKLHGAESKVLAVVHGVQPVTGSGAAYWRMKCGFERSGAGSSRIAALVLGADGEEVTALMANMPGGLQLLPTADYTANDGEKGWLRAVDETGRQIQAGPRNDPYREIYAEKEEFWRLVDPEFLPPPKGAGGPYMKSASGWDYYEGYLKEAARFHQQLGLEAHGTTFAFHSTELKTADAPEYSVQEFGPAEIVERAASVGFTAAVGGAAAGPPGAVVAGAVRALVESDWWANRGGFRTYTRTGEREVREINMKDPAGSGDGTVPESSGNALEDKLQGDPLVLQEVEHEPAYVNSRARQFTIQSIQRVLKEKVDRA